MGLRAIKPLPWLEAMGVDVIVTDHHSMPEVLPDAYAIIHPEHRSTDTPFIIKQDVNCCL